MASEDHKQATPPEQTARYLRALQDHGYSVKERRYGWLVTEPLGGRQRIESVEQLAEYTARFVRSEKKSAPEDQTNEATAAQYAAEAENATGEGYMVAGVVSMAVGVILILAFYETAADGGTDLEIYGLIATGVVLFVGGLLLRSKYRKRRQDEARREAENPERS